jgi:hypothetical protein
LVAVFLGTTAVVLALMLAVLTLGPVLRFVVGPPAGYGTDVTSRDAYVQALAAQLVSVVVVFLVLGTALGRRMTIRHWRSALWVANPLTVGIGYWIFRSISSANWPYEYKAYHGWLMLTILAPLILAPCVSLGARLGQQKA